MCEIGEEQSNSRLVCDCLPSRQANHMRNTRCKLKSQVPKGLSLLISRLGQLTRCIASLFCVLFSFLYPHYKSPHYPWNCKKNLREKTLEIHLRVRDCTPTILYKILLIFLYSSLSNSIHIERFLAQTHTTLNLSVVSCFGSFGKYWMKPFFGACKLSPAL